jgi:hypothetical protein
MLAVGAPGETRTISTQALTLRSSTIITNGADLTIEVIDLILDNASIRSFEKPDTATEGQKGRDGGVVQIRVHGDIVGDLQVNLSGEAGDNGKNGETGNRGSTGAKGDNAASGLFDCKRGAGRGGKGGTGGRGGDGMPGLAGGNGGTLIVIAAKSDSVRPQLQFTSLGGKGGKGGRGGVGGEGGDGGPGGSPVGLCSGSGPRGAAGERGPSGEPGPNGADGTEGKIQFMESSQVSREP